MTAKVKCAVCGKVHNADESYYVGPSKPHCSEEHAKVTIANIPSKKKEQSKSNILKS